MFCSSKPKIWLPIALTFVVLGATTAFSQPTNAPPKSDGNPTYLRDMMPIFTGDCFRCHNSQSRFLPDWTDYQTAYHYRLEIKRRVWDSWRNEYFKQSMPAGNGAECRQITEEQRALVKKWVNSGAPYGVLPPAEMATTKAGTLQAGQHLFSTICAACHQPDARGLPGKFPPLTASDFLNADKGRAINTVTHGLQGEITVNGQTFNNSMPAVPLRDEDVANVLTYLYSSFGNSGKEVTADEVKAVRVQAQLVNAVAPAAAMPAAPKSRFE